MFINRNRSGYGTYIQRKKKFHAAAVIVGVSVVVLIFAYAFLTMKNRWIDDREELLSFWEGGNYREAYALSKSELQDKPMDFFLLSICGFSAYQMGISQINTLDTLTYIDDCILTLRKALLLKSAVNTKWVYYVLGKAYYYKGREYADLAVKYLEMARNAGYTAGDIPEYLGLAYAAVRDYRASVAVFSLALEPVEHTPESSAGPMEETRSMDALFLSIARSYAALEEYDAAKAYLMRCIETSRDSDARIAARLLFGSILEEEADGEGAEAQYNAVIAEAGENAEARFRLGELYNARRDTTRARAEWRRAWRADPAHQGARRRLNM